MVGKFTAVMQKYDGSHRGPQVFRSENAGQSENAASGADHAPLSNYLEIMARRKWIIIALAMITVGTVAIVSLLMTPSYEATVKIMLGMQPTLTNPVGDASEYSTKRNVNFQTQINLFSSRSLAQRVIDELGLETIAAEMDHTVSVGARHQDIKDPGAESIPSENLDAEKKEKSLKWYLEHLEVAPIEESSLVDISFLGTNPDLITRIINKHAQAAIDYAISRHQSQAKEALDWLKKQIEEQKAAVQKSQLAMYQFKKKNDVLYLDNGQIAITKELQELNDALARAKSERIMKQAVYLQLTELGNTNMDDLLLPEIANYPTIQQMRNQLVGLNFRRIEMKTKYGPKHPKMIELNNGIGQLKNEILREIDRLKGTIKADLDRAAAIEAATLDTLNKQKKTALSLTEKSIEYEVLKQQADSAQDIYDFLLKQSEQISLSTAISSSSMRVVDWADIPTDPVKPRVYLNIVVATFVGLFLGLGTAFIVDQLDNTVKTSDDVASKLDLPVLGVVPFQKKLQNNNGATVLLEDYSFQKTGKYKNAGNALYHISCRLPDRLHAPTEGLCGKVLIIDSVSAGEGKSTTAARIASNMAKVSQRVLLVDCDFLRPAQEKIFQQPAASGGLGQFIDLLTSHNLTKGSLRDYSVDDLFFLIGLKRVSGYLKIENEGQILIALFHHGALLHIHSQDPPETGRIGNMLLKAGFITKDQLEDALGRHHRTGQPLGYILVNAGYIDREKLRGPLRLQVEEYLQKLFSWRNGQFELQPGMARSYENEKIFFDENYMPYIKNIAKFEISHFFESQLFARVSFIKEHNFYLLGAGDTFHPVGSLNPLLMEKVFEKLRMNFDIVLVDMPPLEAASGIESIISFSDGIVLVVQSGHLNVKIINSAISTLPREKIIGTVLNQVKASPHPYYG